MAPNASDVEFMAILHWIEDRTGLKFRDDQHGHTIANIRRVMESLDIKHPSDLKRALEQRPAVMNQMVNELTIGETYFFRERGHFEFIGRTILPELRKRRGMDHTIRAWSAGCASGEEAYSLAIVCQQQGISNNVEILATDISAAALDKARLGIFRAWSFRGDAMSVVRPYLTKSGDEFRLNDSIKRQVTFRPLNLASKVYPSPINGTSDVDLILCRNVLIYFGGETIREIGRRMYDCLAQGGWLLTASGDPSLRELANFAAVNTKHGIFYRKPTQASPNKSPDVTAARRRRPEIRPQPARGVSSTRESTSQPQTSQSAGRARRADPSTANLLALSALESEDYSRAIGLTEDSADDPTACLINIRATAALDPAGAIEKCRLAVGRHTLSEQLHYLHGLLLADANRTLEALQSVQKALFLDRSFVMAHFLFASIQYRRGQLESARRHFRCVCQLCASRQPTEVLPLGGGQTVADLAVAAASQLSRIDTALNEDT